MPDEPQLNQPENGEQPATSAPEPSTRDLIRQRAKETARDDSSYLQEADSEDINVKILEKLKPDFEKDSPYDIRTKIQSFRSWSEGRSYVSIPLPPNPKYPGMDLGEDLSVKGSHTSFAITQFLSLEPGFRNWLEQQREELPLPLQLRTWGDIRSVLALSESNSEEVASTNSTTKEIANIDAKITEVLVGIAKETPKANITEINTQRRRLESASDIMTTELAEAIKAGAYDVIIGDDTHGRLPALLVHDITQRYAKDHPDAKKPPLLFVAGGQTIYDRTEAIREHFQKLFQKDHYPSRALFVTEIVATGDSEKTFAQIMKELGVPTDVATIEVDYGHGGEDIGDEHAKSVAKRLAPEKLFYNYSTNDLTHLHDETQGTVKKPENFTKALADRDDKSILNPTAEDIAQGRKAFVPAKTNRILRLQKALMPVYVEELYDRFFW